MNQPWVYLCSQSSAICKASSDNQFPFLHVFFFGMVLVTDSCTVLWTSVHSFSGTLPDLIPWIYLSPPLYKDKGFDLGKPEMPSGFPYFFNLSLLFAIRGSWYEAQSAPGLVFADCIQLIHLWLQRIKLIWFQYRPFGDIHV